ncbi:MAG: TolC family protein [Aureliella sp.]
MASRTFNSVPGGGARAEAIQGSGPTIVRAASFRMEPDSGIDDDFGAKIEAAEPLMTGIGSAGDLEARLVEPMVGSTSQVDRYAADSETELQSLIAQALSVHPIILAARQRVAALSNRVPQVTSLDDPVLGNTFWPLHDQALQTAGGRVGHQFSLAQKVPWPEKLKARGLVAQRETQIAAAEVAKAEREIVEAVRLAYYELWLADRLTEIASESQELVGDLITIAQSRYKTGGSQRDILQAEMESNRLDDQLISLRLQKEQARADLGALVRQPIDLMPTALEELELNHFVPDLKLLIAEAEQCNPSLQGLASEIERDRAKQTLACLQQYPDFQLGLGYSIISDDGNVISPVADGRDNINFSVGVSLPIWRDKINGGVREAAHQRNSTIHLREAERDRLRGQLRRKVAAAYASIEQLELFRDRLIPKTEQTLEIATIDYQGKRAEFAELIATYRELLNYQVQVARAQASLASTMAQIEKDVGFEAYEF